MDISGHIKREFRKLGGGVLSTVVRKLQTTFPGVTWDSLRQGWIPVPGGILEEEVRRHLGSMDGVRSVSLQCCRGFFALEVETGKWRARHAVACRLASEYFRLDHDRGEASFLCKGDMSVTGRNLLGSLTAWLAQSILLKALHSGKPIICRNGIPMQEIQLAWPQILVDLRRIEPIGELADRRFLGLGLLDVLAFGPLEVEDGHVRLKTTAANTDHGRLLAGFLRQVRSRGVRECVDGHDGIGGEGKHA